MDGTKVVNGWLGGEIAKRIDGWMDKQTNEQAKR